VETDWRLTPDHELFRGAGFTRKPWYAVREGWDHDHCEFCWAKFGEPHRREERLQEGYTTAGPLSKPPTERGPDYHWVCVRCFEDFRERFGWSSW
jgi:hypothetical protein